MASNDLILVTSPLLPDLQEFNQYLQQIWDSKWITNNGSFHQQFVCSNEPLYLVESTHTGICGYRGRNLRYGSV